jgi:hypothetical protein
MKPAKGGGGAGGGGGGRSASALFARDYIQSATTVAQVLSRLEEAHAVLKTMDQEARVTGLDNIAGGLMHEKVLRSKSEVRALGGGALRARLECQHRQRV